jgi:hypothetical protein
MPRVPTTAVRRLGTLAAGLLLLAGLASVPASADETGSTPDPTAPTLAVGACHDLTLKQIDVSSIPVEPVDCAGPHTAVVTAVPTLPASLTWTSAREDIVGAASSTCWTALEKQVGTNPLLFVRAQYDIAWYEPTQAQKDAGARWFTCHAIVAEDSRLADLPQRLIRLSSKMPDSIARCGAPRTLAYTTCADRHVARATYAFYVGKKLTQRNADAAAAAVCPRHVPRLNRRKWLMSTYELGAKKFIVVCYAKTTR